MTARGVAVKFVLITIVALLASHGCAADPESKKAESKSQEKSSGDKSKPVTIPLNQIWAYRMPGTRDIGKLEKDKPPQSGYGRLIGDIRRTLGTTLERGKDAGPAFAVSGSGIDALREAHAVLVGKQKPRERFPANSDVSIVFSSYSAGSYVELDKVRHHGNVIDVQYRFHLHSTAEMTEHIAIIPLTSLTSGKYRVNVVQSPVKDREKFEFRFFEPEIANKIVSGSFDFTIE